MLSSSSSSISHLANGATTQFPFPFTVLDSAHLVVTVTDTTVSPVVATTLSGAQYVASGIPGTGTVTISPALPVGRTVTLRRVVPALQQAELENQGGFYPKVVERALDYLTMLVQQVQEQISRSYIAPVGASIDAQSYIDGAIVGVTAASATAATAAATATAAASAATAAASGLSTFTHVAVPGQPSLSPTGLGDTLTLAAGSGISLTTDAAARRVTMELAVAPAAASLAADLQQAVLQLFMMDAMNHALGAGGFVNGAWDLFAVGTTLAGSAGGTYDSANKLWWNPAVAGEMIPAATGTVVGNFTANAALYDGTTRGTHISGGSYSTPNGAVGKSGKAWPTAQAIGKVRLWDTTNYNINTGGSGTVTVKVYGSNTGYDTGATLLATASITNQANVGYQDVDVVGAAAYLWTWVTLGEGQSIPTYIAISEVQWFTVSTSSPAMTLTASALSPATAPARVQAQLWWAPGAAGGTLNTDLILELTRDGATWAAAPLADSGIDPVSGFNLLTAAADLGSQPAGTALQWRLRTTAKTQKVKGVALAWS